MDASIDALLERYLGLLDEYTRIRASLGAAQSGMYQSIARANFAAERGMRYGPDCFDERMQANRRLSIAFKPFSVGHEAVSPLPIFAVLSAESTELHGGSRSGGNDDQGEELGGPAVMDDEGKEDARRFECDPAEDAAGGAAKERPKDPLRWFGLLTPASLRQAQAQAVQIVEDLVPQLLSINAEMAQVEIEIRRAKKRRAKAATVGKDTNTSQQPEGGLVETA